MIPHDEAALRSYLGQDPASFPVNWMVEAGAGAGKTFLIVQRMVSQLAAGYCRPEQLVAITFTNKAANQLRDRLTAALLERRDHAADDKERRNLENALQKTDDIQISTVHSFCQRLLREMPLAAGLPFAFTLQEASESQRDAARFFAECCRDHDDWFAPVRAYGIQPASLEDAFLRLLGCGDDALVYSDDAAFAKQAGDCVRMAEGSRLALQQSFPAGRQGWAAPLLAPLLTYPPITTPEQAVGWFCLLKKLAASKSRSGAKVSLSVLLAKDSDPTDPPPAVVPQSGSAQAYRVKAFDAQLVVARDTPPAAACEKLQEWTDFSQADKALEKTRRLKKSTQEDIARAQADRDQKWNALQACLARPEYQFVRAGYALLQFRKDLAAPLQKAVSPLVHTVILRVLLRCRAALVQRRAARGQLGYDDLLLRCRDLLKHSPEARSRLAARGLILYVDEFQDTDPIQAQILFYLTASSAGFSEDWTQCVPRKGSLFLVGDPKQSIYRFRRADIQVYNQVRTLFDGGCPGCRLAVLRFNFRSSAALCGYATDVFRPLMQGQNGQPGFTPMEARNARVPDRDVGSFTADPQKAPDGVAAWIDQAVAGGQARWKDFLILCDQKQQVEDYRRALHARQIPVNATGQHCLADTVPIARCANWCRYLLHPGDPVDALPLLLDAGFGPGTLYALQQAAGRPLTELLQRTADEWQQPLPDTLQAVARRFVQMAVLRQKSRTLPPMALLTELLCGPCGLWDGAPDPESYGWVQEYLAQLRQWPDQSLTGLLNRAIRLCRVTLEHPLAYTDSADEVQVMNLHKAKGLEGRIVILAPSGRKAQTPVLHLEGGQAWLRLKVRLESPDGGGVELDALPPDWDNQCAREQGLQEAERIRLLYVAATRAEELLLVGHIPAGTRSADAWEGLAGQECLTSQTADLLPGLGAKALFEPQEFPPQNTAAAPVLPGPETDAACKAGLAALPRAGRVAVTPSRLDHPAPPAALDPEAEEAAPPAESAPAQAGESRTAAPRGGDWGTIVHRTLELAVNGKAWDAPQLQTLAARAVEETLPEEMPLSARQYRQLTGAEEALPHVRLAGVLARQAAEAAAPLLADGSPLRGLLAEGEAVTEYPFCLSVSDPEDALYRHLSANLTGAPAGQLPIDLNGILDLAIRTPEGWTVVDYKTDRPAPGETEESYCRRLRSEYGPQLRTYTLVLERLEHRPVRCFVCAVPLGGQLIELTAAPES